MPTTATKTNDRQTLATVAAETGRTFTAFISDGALFVDDSDARTVRIDNTQLSDWANTAYSAHDVVAAYWRFWTERDGHLFTAACVELVTQARATDALARLL